MSHLADLISPTNTLCKHSAKSRKRILQTIAEHIADGPEGSVSADNLFEGLMERERLGSTGLGEGVAIPHCRVACSTIRIALVTLDQPIDYEAMDGEPVDLIFVLVVPEDEQTIHLDALAELSKVFVDPVNRDQLRQCTDAQSLADKMRHYLRGAADPGAQVANIQA
ncbi:MAG: PTS sugar transporter subunit IIA [Pseudomonadota bacterium]